jgi:uncharacterized protein YkwD
LTGKHLAALAVVGLLLLGRLLLPAASAAMPTPEESQQIGWQDAGDVEGLARDVFHRINDERAARGLAALAWDADLARLAEGWSTRMIASTFEHSPDSYRAHPRFPWGVGENIAMGQEASDEVHVAWMLSPGHRANILEPAFGAVGVGIVCRNDGRMWATQLFAPTPASIRAASTHPAVDVGPEPVVRDDPGIACPRSLRYRVGLSR